MDQRPTKATFVSRDVQSAAQRNPEEIERELKETAFDDFYKETKHEEQPETEPTFDFSENRPLVFRYTRPSYAYTGRKYTGKKQKQTTYGYSGRMARRVVICCVLAAGCWGMKYIKLPAAQKTTEFLKSVFTYDLNIEETIGRLQFVQKILPDVKAVFGDQRQFDYPVSGAIIQKYGEDGKEYIQFQAKAKAEVKAALDGQVEKRGISDTLGKYLKIRHANHLTTVYYGMEESPLAEGADVKQGQTLGTLGQDGLLCFKVLSGEMTKDPQKYLGVK